MNNKDLFDKLFNWTCKKLPGIGPRFANYYEHHKWFQRLSKFGTTTLVMFWLVKAPILWFFDLIFVDINLVFFTIPSYVPAAFIAGLIVTVGGFAVNELWIWDHNESS